jgi:hypothetical protein
MSAPAAAEARSGAPENVDEGRRGLAVAAAAAAGAAAGLLSGARPANAAMAVFDSSVFAQAVQQVKNGAEAVGELQRQVAELESLTSVTGMRGGAPAGSGFSGTLRTIQAAVRPPRMDFDAWELPRELDRPSFSSVERARDFMDRTLMPTPDRDGNVGYANRDELQSRRVIAERDAALTGYSVALNQRESLEASFNRAANLADAATAAQTMMEQQRATNNLMAALLSEVVQLRAVIAAQLEVQATGAIREMPMLITGGAPTGALLSPSSAGRLGE